MRQEGAFADQERTVKTDSTAISTEKGWQFNTNDKINENALDSFFLLRFPKFLDTCGIELADRQAVLVISQGTPDGAIKVADVFSIIAENSDIVHGTIERVITTCEEAGMGIDKLSYGMLSLDKILTWPHAYTAYLAVKGASLRPGMVGSVKNLPRDLAEIYRDKIDEVLPDDEEFFVDEVNRLSLPGIGQEFDFISGSHHNNEEFKKSMDRADKSASFLFIKNGELLLRDDGIEGIIAITALNTKGIYAVLVRGGGRQAYEGTYEIRLFDGKKFSESKKVLYRWMD